MATESRNLQSAHEMFVSRNANQWRENQQFDKDCSLHASTILEQRERNTWGFAGFRLPILIALNL